MKKIKIPTVLLTVFALFLSVTAFFCPQVQAASAGKWIASWTTAGIESTVTLAGSDVLTVNDFIPSGSTVRTELQLSAGGLYLRFKLSNEFGKQDVTIGAACVAQTATPGTAAIREGTSAAVTFNDGLPQVTIPAGGSVWTDSIYFPTSPLEYISVSLYFPNATAIKTAGLFGGKSFLSTPISIGNASQVDKASLFNATEINISSKTITYHTIPFLTNVDVRSTNENAYSVVFIGDSTLTNEAYHYFAQRAYSKGYEEVGFVNNSIVANRLLYDGVGLIGNLYGPATVDRFGRDALEVTGAKAVLVKIGLNDVLHPRTKSMAGKAPMVSAEQIIAGYEQLITRAHNAGMKIWFFTNTAWKGYERSFLGQSGDLTWTQEAQDVCNALDSWIKTTKLHDGYFDMSTMSNPVDTNALLPVLTSDGAHLTTLGAVAMADLISPSVIGARSLPYASDINDMNPYATQQEVIASYQAVQKNTTNVKTSTETPATVQTEATKVTRSQAEDNAVGEYARASRQAINEASAKAANGNTKQNASVTSAATTAKTTTTTTTKKAETTTESAGFLAKVKNLFGKSDTKTQATTVKNNTTVKSGNTNTNTTTAKQSVATTVAGKVSNANAVAVTQKASAVAASKEASMRNMANVQIVDNGTPTVAQTATAASAATVANEYSIVAAMEDAGIQVEVEQNPVTTPQQQNTQPKMRSNGTAIGVLMVIVLVAAVAGAVAVSITGHKRKYH